MHPATADLNSPFSPETRQLDPFAGARDHVFDQCPRKDDPAVAAFFRAIGKGKLADICGGSRDANPLQNGECGVCYVGQLVFCKRRTVIRGFS